MRIAFVGHLLGDIVFGAERSLLDILAALDPREHEAVCVFPRANSDYLRTVARYTERIHVFPYRWWHRTRRVDPASVVRFERIFRRERVDLVHVNTITLMDPLVAARRIGIPGVLHARELICHDAQLAALLGEDPDTIVHMVQEASDFIIGTTDETCRLFGVSPSEFRLYNGVDVDRFDLPNTLEPGRLRIGIISSNLPKKGIDSFVRLAVAGRHRPDLEFLVVGPRNKHTDTLEDKIRQELLPVHIRFIGHVEDPVEAMRQLDIVVSLSDVFECCPRTVIEGMAAGRPVIAWANRGGASEIIRHGKDGFLVPYLDIAETLRRLEEFAYRPDLVRELGRNARERAKRVFSHDAMGLRLKEIYPRIAAAWETLREEARSRHLEALRSRIARSAAYFHPLDADSVPFRIGAGISCSVCSDAKTGTRYISIANGGSNAASSGATDGYSVRLPDSIEAAVSGNRVSVNVVARAARGARSRFALAYSTNEVGNSGWRWQDAGREWGVFTMDYDVPPMKNGNGDFVGILPDTQGRHGTEFCCLSVAWVRRDQEAAHTARG